MMLVAVVVIIATDLAGSNDTKRVVSKEVLTDFNFDDTASVTRIEITETVLGRKAIVERQGSTWIINGKHQARKDLIDLILNTFKTIRFQNYLPRNAVQNILKEISSANKEVKIYRDGEHRYTWFVGSASKDHEGTYMMLEKKEGDTWVRSSEPVIMGALRFRGELNTRFTGDEMEWRHTGMYSYLPSDIAKIEVSYPSRPQDDFRIEIDKQSIFTLYNGDGRSIEQPDTASMRKYAVQFKKVHFETFNRVYTQERVDSLKQTTPLFVMTVSNHEGEERSVMAYPIQTNASMDFTGTEIEYDVDRMHGIFKGELVVIQYFVFDSLTKKLTDFLGFSQGVENNIATVNNQPGAAD